MQASAILAAATLLADARRQGRPLPELPVDARPDTFAEAAAIQQETARLLGEPVAAYKVAGVDPATLTWGGVLGSLLRPSPASFPAASVPLLGIEAEIAYRLERDITAADRGMTMAELDACTSVLPAIEVVATRFVSYRDTPAMQRHADFMSNGGLVHGEPWADAAGRDLTQLGVTLRIGGEVVADGVGGHSAGDPRRPALAFIQAPGRPDHLPRGTILTTGTFTGLLFARPGDTVTASFAGYGEVTVSFPA